jgi:cystathionine beta-lyase/cystathionine gamma-synthase
MSSGFGTRAIHAGQAPDPTTGAVIPPLSLSTTYKQSAAGVHSVSIFFSKKKRGLENRMEKVN